MRPFLAKRLKTPPKRAECPTALIDYAVIRDRAMLIPISPAVKSNNVLGSGMMVSLKFELVIRAVATLPQGFISASALE
jgi:hypothetical protein